MVYRVCLSLRTKIYNFVLTLESKCPVSLRDEGIDLPLFDSINYCLITEQCSAIPVDYRIITSFRKCKGPVVIITDYLKPLIYYWLGIFLITIIVLCHMMNFKIITTYPIGLRYWTSGWVRITVKLHCTNYIVPLKRKTKQLLLPKCKHHPGQRFR